MKCLYRDGICDHRSATHKSKFHSFSRDRVLAERWLLRSGIPKVAPKKISPFTYLCSCLFSGGGKERGDEPVEFIEDVDDVSSAVLLCLFVPAATMLAEVWCISLFQSDTNVAAETSDGLESLYYSCARFSAVVGMYI